MKLHNLLGIFAAIVAMGLAPSASAEVATGNAAITQLRLRPVGDSYLRIQFDKDLNCGARMTGSDRTRAWLYVPGTTGGGAPSQDDFNRVQSFIMAAFLAGKKVTVVVDETATSGVYANSCKLVELLVAP